MESMDKLLSSVEDIKEKLTDKEYKKLMDTMKQVKEDKEIKDKYVKVMEIVPKLMASWCQVYNEDMGCQESGVTIMEGCNKSFCHDSTNCENDPENNHLEKVECRGCYTIHIKILKVEKREPRRAGYGNDYIEIDFLERIKQQDYLHSMSGETAFARRIFYVCDM
jgi:hypothetical protein